MNAALQENLDSRFQHLAAGHILWRTWFTRVWIYQELVLSKGPWIQCGRKRVRWNAIYAALCPKTGREDPENYRCSLVKSAANQDRNGPTQEGRLVKLFSDMHAARQSRQGKLPRKSDSNFILAGSVSVSGREQLLL
jgi:hypothetical protein